MTARRVIDDHKDLDNIGSLTHVEIDSHVNTTPFVITSGAMPLAPPTARYLAAGSGIDIRDDGPGLGLVISSTASTGSFVFPNDLTVSLAGGRSFGRYASGEVIPATGKTPAEVILMAISEPISPAVALTAVNPLTSAFNTTGIVGTILSASYTIKSSGATISSASLEYRVGNSGPWTLLTSAQDDPFAGVHNFNAPSFFTSTVNYQYTIVDTMGAYAVASASIVPQPYAPPQITLNISEVAPGGVTGESNLKREKGNVGSLLGGSIVRQRVNVPITSYSVQFSTNNSVWTDVPGLSAIPVAGNPSSVNIPSTTHNDPALVTASSIYYRVVVDDIYATTYSPSTAVNFFNVIRFGPCSSSPLTSSDVRSLSARIFTDAATPAILQTGNTQRIFAIALPQPIAVTEVVDLDALNAVITSNYALTTFGVQDAGGTISQYNVYAMTNAIPYTGNHRHQFKRA